VIVRPVLCQPFVGRREELAYLNERRLEAGSSHGGLVLIAGEAGVGKSRLISEFCASLARSRWRIGYGQCDASASRPYGPILDVLTALDPAPFELGATETKREQHDAIVNRFAAIAARRALIVAIEDVHWADAATLDLLAYLGPKLHNMRVLVLASFRLADLPPGHHAIDAVAKVARDSRAGRIDLPPLRGPELRTFIDEALSGFDLPADTRRAIALAGEGNPFFTEELLKSAVEAKSVEGRARKTRELPQTVRATLLERLRPFDENERQIVTQAAVIGRTFGLDLLAATLETQPASLLPTLRRARDFQLVEELAPAVFRFRHGLTRDAIYGDFLGAELAPRHRSIALALEKRADDLPLEALAYHWWAAGDGAKSARYNELAGDEATRVHAHEDAIAFYERALETPDLDAIARGSIVQKMAERRGALTWIADSGTTYARAADIFRDAGAFAREAICRSNAAIQLYQSGAFEPTAPLEAMLARLDESEYVARSRVHLGLSWLTATFWFPTRAAYHLSQVDPRARQEEPDIESRFHNVSAWVAMTFGDVDGFRRELAAWIAAAEALGSPQAVAVAHCNGGMCFSFFALHEESLEHIERSKHIAREARLFNVEDSAHSVSVMTHLLRGDLKSARAALESVSSTSESRFNTTYATSGGTIVAAHLGDRTLIETWFDPFESIVSAAPEIECGAGFAEIMVRRGRERDAEALLHRALPDCELVRGNVLTLLATARYGAAEDRKRARDFLVKAAAGSRELPERPALALFDAIVHVRNDRSDDARAFALEAAEGFRRLRMPLLEAAALEVAGDVEAALVLYHRSGAAYDVGRLTAASSQETELLPPDVAAATTALSPREREVAMLAGSGHSNLEISRQLFITLKTVEKHLASVYRKLSITSRTKLSAYIAPHVR
jgi:DNA-binding CsgD family transcriptional regulator/tetratricopeptide (TPR) repeat protein